MAIITLVDLVSESNRSREYLKSLTEEEKYLIGIDYFIKMKEQIDKYKYKYDELPELYHIDNIVGHLMFTIKDFLPKFKLHLSEYWFCVTLKDLETYPRGFTLQDMQWSELYSLKWHYLMARGKDSEFIQELDRELEIKELELCL